MPAIKNSVRNALLVFISLISVAFVFQNCGKIALTPVEMASKAEFQRDSVPFAISQDASLSTNDKVHFIVQEYKADSVQQIRVSQKSFRWSFAKFGDLTKTDLPTGSYTEISRPAVSSCDSIFVYASYEDEVGPIEMFYEYRNPDCPPPAPPEVVPPPVTPTTMPPGPTTINIPGTGTTPRGCQGSGAASTLPGIPEPPVPISCQSDVPYVNGKPYGVLTRNMNINVLNLIGANCPVTRNVGLKQYEFWSIRVKVGPKSVVNFAAAMDASGGPYRTIVTISDCPGDFGPVLGDLGGSDRAPSSRSMNGSALCTRVFGVESVLVAATSDYPGVNQSQACILEPNKNYYVNVVHAMPGNILQHPSLSADNPTDPAYACRAFEFGRACGLTIQTSVQAGTQILD